MWSQELGTSRGLEATPIVEQGVIYTTGSWSVVFAFDARTGKTKWSYDPRVPREHAYFFCCDVVNRGVALHNGKVYVGTLDGRLIALDQLTGTPVWRVQTSDPAKAYSITAAPVVAREPLPSRRHRVCWEHDSARQSGRGACRCPPLCGHLRLRASTKSTNRSDLAPRDTLRPLETRYRMFLRVPRLAYFSLPLLSCAGLKSHLPGGAMLQQQTQTESRDLEWICEGVSPMDDPCDAKASYHCGICGKWFCSIHAEDEAWHRCALEPGDEGGEG